MSDFICDDCYEVIEGEEENYHMMPGQVILKLCAACYAIRQPQPQIINEEHIHVPNLRFMTMEQFAKVSGIPPDGIRGRKKRGQWKEGEVWHKREGTIFIDTEGYEKWILGQKKTEQITAVEIPQ